MLNIEKRFFKGSFWISKTKGIPLFLQSLNQKTEKCKMTYLSKI